MKRIADIKYWEDAGVFIIIILAFILLGTRALPISLTLCAAYVIPCGLYAQSAYSNVWGRVALSVAFISMSVFMLLNYWQSTVQLGTVDNPFLLHDAQSFYLLSHDIHQGSLSENSPIVPYMGYPLFLSWWLAVGIDDIAYPVIFNIALMLTAVIMVGRCVYFVIDDKAVAQRVSGYAMMLVAFIPGVLGTSTLLAKEPFIILAMLLCVCALYALKQRYKVLKYALLLLLGLIILAACRATYIYVILLFSIVIWGYKLTWRDGLLATLVLMVMLVILNVGIHFSWWGDSSFVEKYISDSGSHSSFFCGESQAPLQQLLGEYDSYPLWLRLLLLPVCVAIQFMIPFPFITATPDYGLPISMTVYHRMSYLWYIAAIPMLVFYLFYWWRKGSGLKFNLLALVSAIAYCIPAFMTAGSVSRYAYCFVPFLAIMGGYVIYRVIENREELKRMGVFTIVYFVLISAALFIGAHPHLIVR